MDIQMVPSRKGMLVPRAPFVCAGERLRFTVDIHMSFQVVMASSLIITLAPKTFVNARARFFPLLARFAVSRFVFQMNRSHMNIQMVSSCKGVFISFTPAEYAWERLCFDVPIRMSF